MLNAENRIKKAIKALKHFHSTNKILYLRKSIQNTRHKYEKNSYINKNRTRPHRNSKKLQKKFRKYVTSFSVLQKHLLF